jgi:2-polyprenyl-6-methoxyphenol hydroxylase-like FAD-dependent oxidoreductase
MKNTQNAQENQYDIVVVGAGIGGSAMAVVLAQAGFEVLLLEKSVVHKDVVRGEWLAPWGVLEADQLGLTDLYMAHGGHRIDRHVSYGELVTPQEAESNSVNMIDVVGERPLCLGHPTTYNLLNERAVELGVTFKRGVKKISVSPGTPPRVKFQHDDVETELSPRLVIGADGRNGLVAKQIGCELDHDPEHHLFSGMLVEDAYDWPEDLQVIATEGDVNVLAFPQGEGRVRIYLGWPSADRARLVGPDGPKRFLASWQLASVPHADAISAATPISPCIAYPNFDAWVDSPVRDGVVLIGDAAGRNDPIIGQGLSIAHRDVRLVRDALASNAAWDLSIFDEYVEERKERMARLRTVARLTSLRESAFGEAGHALRESIHENVARNQDLATPYIAGFVGPHNLPAEVFSAPFVEQIVGQPIWGDLP